MKIPKFMRRAATGATPTSGKVTARYLRGDNIGTLNMRRAVMTDHRNDVRAAWSRSGALAVDMLQNSGRLSGATDQVLADTVGAGLQLSATPDFTALGWDAEQRTEWIKIVERRWNRWASNPLECDLRGKQTVAQMVDASIRWYLVFGESLGIISFLTPAQRRRRGARSGTKICMTSPHKLVQDTNELEGLFQGVIHDPDGLPVYYRFKEKNAGISQTRDYPARDREGRQLTIHVMDGQPGDVRGIGVFAPVIKTFLTYDQLTDATHTQQLIQTIFAATLKSSTLDGDALAGILNLNDIGNVDSEDLIESMVDYTAAKYDVAEKRSIDFGTHGRVNVLPPGDDLVFHRPSGVVDSYEPLSMNLLREIARCVGITVESLTMNHNGATYSSVRMATSSIWPVVTKRRMRIAVPTAQPIYESFLDEEIGEGRIPFLGGYNAFRANRADVVAASWRGPPKPTADDLKSAKAVTERLLNGTSSIKAECADTGHDADDITEQRGLELRKIEEEGLPNPFERNPGAGEPDEEDPEVTKSIKAATDG